MKWSGYKRIAFASVRMDVAEIRRRAKEARVSDLANNIREHGEEPIHAPTIRMPGKTLLCGRDRMAALMTLKVKRVWVRIAECTDLEAADLEASENVHRRQDSRSDVLARAVFVKEQLLAAREPGTVSQAPQHSRLAEARKAVARDAGVSTGAVRKAQQRAKARANDSAGATPSGPTPGAPAVEAEEAPAGTFDASLNLLGCDDVSTRAVCKFARPAQEAIDESDKHLRLALGALKRIELTELGQRLRRDVERVGSLVRSERPESVCPWCKGLPKATVGVCNGCKGIGYVSAARAKDAPRECFYVDPPLVVLNGKFLPYADVRDGHVPNNGTVTKSGKRVRVEDASGREIPLDD